MDQSLMSLPDGASIVLINRQELQLTTDPCAREDLKYCYHLKAKINFKPKQIPSSKESKTAKFKKKRDADAVSVTYFTSRRRGLQRPILSSPLLIFPLSLPSLLPISAPLSFLPSC